MEKLHTGGYRTTCSTNLPLWFGQFPSFLLPSVSLCFLCRLYGAPPPSCVLHQHPVTWTNNTMAGTRKTDEGKPLQNLNIFDSQRAGLGSRPQGAPWVFLTLRSVPNPQSDHPKCSSVSIDSERSNDETGLWVYSAMYHYRQVSRPVDGWAVLPSPFITLVNSEGIFFFFFTLWKAHQQWISEVKTTVDLWI